MTIKNTKYHYFFIMFVSFFSLHIRQNNIAAFSLEMFATI